MSRRRRGPPGWARAKQVLVRMLAARGVDRPQDHVGRTRFLGEGLSFLTYLAWCELPGDGGRMEQHELVVRLPREEDAERLVPVVTREARLLELLTDQSLPIRLPCPVATVPADPGLASVQSAVSGLPLERHSATALELLAEVAALLHGIDLAPLAELLPQHAHRRAHACAALELLQGLELPEAQRALRWATAHVPPPTPARLPHGDLLGQNILLPWQPDDGPHPGVIDWEYAQLGDPAYDLAIATRGARQPFGRADGLRQLVTRYNALARDQLTVAQVQLHELVLVGGFCRAAAEEYGSDSPAAENEQRRLRALLRRSGA